jgi:glycosyltransferase involved in cell wall biosynthesis
VPCIVSDINGCNEIISRGTTGLIVNPKDAEALYQAIIDLIRHPEKRELFSTRARTFVRTHFDQRSIWEALLGEYTEGIKKSV